MFAVCLPYGVHVYENQLCLKNVCYETTERSYFLHYRMRSANHNVGDGFLTCHMVVCIADLLKHDKVLSKRQPLPHLKSVPEYMRDPSTEAASKALKLARAAMGQISGVKRKRRGRTDDPLRTFSANVSYHFHSFLSSIQCIYSCRIDI